MNKENQTREELTPFDLALYLKGNFRVTTNSGLRVNILTTKSEDKPYKIKGYIGKSTQLEEWTAQGKYYSKNKDIHYNDLTLIQK